jgi:hypothetical protein
MEHVLRHNDVSCLLDCIMQKRENRDLTGDIDRDTLWSFGCGTFGYRTSTIRRLLALGYLEQPVVVVPSRKDFGRPDRFSVRISEAGENAVRRLEPDHPCFRSPGENRARLRVVHA